MGEEQGAQDVGGVELSAGLIGTEQPEVVIGETEPTLMVFDLLALSGHLCRVAGETDRAPFGVVAVDALPFRHAANLVDGVEQLGEEAASSIVVGDLLVTIGSGGELANAPSTVASRCPETDDLLLDHHYPQ